LVADMCYRASFSLQPAIRLFPSALPCAFAGCNRSVETQATSQNSQRVEPRKNLAVETRRLPEQKCWPVQYRNTAAAGLRWGQESLVRLIVSSSMACSHNCGDRSDTARWANGTLAYLPLRFAMYSPAKWRRDAFST